MLYDVGVAKHFETVAEMKSRTHKLLMKHFVNVILLNVTVLQVTVIVFSSH